MEMMFICIEFFSKVKTSPHTNILRWTGYIVFHPEHIEPDGLCY